MSPYDLSEGLFSPGPPDRLIIHKQSGLRYDQRFRPPRFLTISRIETVTQGHYPSSLRGAVALVSFLVPTSRLFVGILIVPSSRLDIVSGFAEVVR